MRSVHDAAGRALAACSMDDKARLVALALEEWRAGTLTAGEGGRILDPSRRGQPARPELVPPRQLDRRGYGTPSGRVAAVHAVAHIEANAIDLALDAVHRFRELPAAFHHDWLQVAADEARHFMLLRDRLRDLGADYGDLPAHGGLWDACAATADDVLRRMALVPRVLEARGLDVNPVMIAGFEAAGDDATAAILRRILADEIGHVATGDRWFRWLCHRRHLAAEATFESVLAEAGVTVRPPLNTAARLAAGFGAEELDRFTGTVRRSHGKPHGAGAGPARGRR